MNTINQSQLRTCFLSPHSDDTFLEAYYIIKECVLPGPYLLCTVFSESNYVDITKKKLYVGTDISKIRKDEDLLFANEFNMQYMTLNEPDCLLRYGTVYFDEHPLENILLDKLYNQLSTCIEEHKIEYIIAPFPFGNKRHYDHRVLCEVAKRLEQNEGITLWWTDDSPYSQTPSDMIKRIIWRKTLTQEEIQYKSSQLDETYPSQTCDYYKVAIKKYDERLFVL